MSRAKQRRQREAQAAERVRALLAASGVTVAESRLNRVRFTIGDHEFYAEVEELL